MELYLAKDENGIPYVQNGDYRLRLDLEELDEFYQKRAYEEYGETPELIQERCQQLREHIKDEKDFCVPMDDAFLLKFLRPNKLDVAKAMKKLRSFYKFIYKHPSYLYGITPQVVKDVFTYGIITFLPFRNDGARLMVLEIAKWDPKVVPIELIFKSVLVAVEIAMKEPKTQLCGVHVIMDTAGLNMQHVLSTNPWIAKLIMDIIKSVPLRVKGIHVINQPKLFDIAYAIFKPFIRGRLKREIILHGKDWETLFEHISPKSVPKKYGGDVDIPPIPGDLAVEMMEFYEKDFEAHLHYGYQKKK